MGIDNKVPKVFPITSGFHLCLGYSYGYHKVMHERTSELSACFYIRLCEGAS